jgi:DNA-binding NtrC family response regulator
MNNHRITNLLWADDDSSLMLKPLQWGLERGGFRVSLVGSYAEAIEMLDNGPVTFESLLVDTILPRATPGTSHPFTGLSLAEYAAKKEGMKCIAFLSVVAHTEVIEKYNLMKKTFSNVRFHYANKLMLLEPYAIEQLVDSLKPPTSR